MFYIPTDLPEIKPLWKIPVSYLDGYTDGIERVKKIIDSVFDDQGQYYLTEEQKNVLNRIRCAVNTKLGDL